MFGYSYLYSIIFKSPPHDAAVVYVGCFTIRVHHLSHFG